MQRALAVKYEPSYVRHFREEALGDTVEFIMSLVLSLPHPGSLSEKDVVCLLLGLLIYY